FLDQHGIMAVRCPSKFDLRRLCRALGATAIARLGAPMEEECGLAEGAESVEIGSDRCLLFRGLPAAGAVATIVLRGSSPNPLDDVERAIDDAIATAKVIFGGPASTCGVVPGAGATEAELSRRLQAFASTCPGIVQYSIR